jgi:L-arabinose isomerase
MKLFEEMNFWFVTGSQFLYGEQTLQQVARNSKIIVEHLNSSNVLPCKVVYRDTMKTAGEITKIVKAANSDDSCAGIIVFCHTFSPSKMWISGLTSLQKPYLHFHTQFNDTIPNDEIDMDYMNLHQSAHGDREHGFIGARLQLKRKVIAGHWKNEDVLKRIGKWMRSAIGVTVSKNMKVMRFGDNMREVAVTEGDKVETQIKLGWEVNTWPVGELAEEMALVTEAQIDDLISEYNEIYSINTSDFDAIRYQAREQIAILKKLDDEKCAAFTNTFQDLHGMNQLPGLATQDIMRRGYGYGGEGDWKTSAMTAIIKTMTAGMSGGTSFMEDYTYDMAGGLVLGAHMLEVCPTIASGKPKIEVHALGIGGKEPPARLVFEGKAGSAILVSLIDMGGRMRLIVHDVECVKPTQTMPNLPVARVMWKPQPDMNTGAECWILAGGAHHTVISFDCDAEMMRDWATMMNIEFVHISADTSPGILVQELAISDLLWKLR